MDADKYSDEIILTLLADALGNSDPAQSEELYNQIVLKVQKAFNNSQRDVAAELQRLAKVVEASRNVDDALSFKQRTCESMLKISMAERHKGKAPPQRLEQLNPKPEPPFKSLEYLLLECTSLDQSVKYHRDTLKGELVWAFNRSGKKIAAIKLAYGPLILLSESEKAEGVQPVFGVANLQATVQLLKQNGVQQLVGPAEMICGTVYSFMDPTGKRFYILQESAGNSLERAYTDPTNKDAIRFT